MTVKAGDIPWGPFVSEHYVKIYTTRGDIITASVLFALANSFALLAVYIGYGQTRACRVPLRCVYVWMIWLELAASVVISIECLLFLLSIIRPSFWFYMSILLNWSIQVQLLLQIIINRIRVILSDRQKGRNIIIGVAVIVTLINISVFCIWIPARLQISHTWIRINHIWDRIEKVLYLLIDGTLNWYFIRVVKFNLVRNGLQKYNRLVRFNQRIIIISLSMDVMIIGAMSFRNDFVYAVFHPLAYLVKLNIEMVMANLIKKIALAGHGNGDNLSALYEFATTDPTASEQGSVSKRRSFLGVFLPEPKANKIKRTEEYSVRITRGAEAEPAQRRCSTTWKVSGPRTVEDVDGSDRDSEENIGATRGTSPPNNDETSAWSISTEEGILARPESVWKR